MFSFLTADDLLFNWFEGFFFNFLHFCLKFRKIQMSCRVKSIIPLIMLLATNQLKTLRKTENRDFITSVY